MNPIDDAIRNSVESAFRQLAPKIRLLIREELAQASRADPDRMLNTTEAAELLGMTSIAVRKAAQRGRLPAVRIGRRLRFRVGALLAMTTTPETGKKASM